MNKLKINGIYKHFKGDYYLVLGLCKNADNLEDMVIYQALYGNCNIYVRSLEEFLSKTDKNKYPNVEQEYRFLLQDIKSRK